MENVATVDDFLEHYGTKGMKWGVRRELKRLSPEARGAYIQGKDAKWLAKVEANPKLSKVSRLTTRYAKKQTKLLKKDYKERGLDIKKSSLARSRYDNEVKVILDQALEKATYKAHKLSPSRLNEVEVQRHPDGTMTARVVARNNAKIAKQFKGINRADERRAKHADDLTIEEFVGLEFFLVTDEEGFVDDIITPFGGEAEQSEFSDADDILAHFGVKGMRWGVRKPPGSPPGPAAATKESSSGRPAWQSAPAGKQSRKEAKKTKQELSADAEVFNALKRKASEQGINSLTNDEIRVLTTRADALNRYKQSFPKQKSKKAKIADFIIGEVLVDTGKMLVKEIARSQGKNYIGKKGLLPAKEEKNKKDD